MLKRRSVSNITAKENQAQHEPWIKPYCQNKDQSFMLSFNWTFYLSKHAETWIHLEGKALRRQFDSMFSQIISLQTSDGGHIYIIFALKVNFLCNLVDFDWTFLNSHRHKVLILIWRWTVYSSRVWQPSGRCVWGLETQVTEVTPSYLRQLCQKGYQEKEVNFIARRLSDQVTIYKNECTVNSRKHTYI